MVTRFRVVLVMTASIPLHVWRDYYIRLQSKKQAVGYAIFLYNLIINLYNTVDIFRVTVYTILKEIERTDRL